jgi:putative inorganic carbon (hco3(-)) transporter
MNASESFLSRAARWLTFASAVSILFSIAASQILLALAFSALLMSGEKMRMPPVKLPLALFALGTAVSLALSADPAAGMPGLRKFFVFLELLVVFSCLRSVILLRALFLSWAGAGAIIALRGYVQFAAKMRQGAGDNYDSYVSERITGFMSHWMTFSGQEMFALLMLFAFILFAPAARKRTWIWILCGLLMSVALLLAFTRSVWIATAIAALYLVWFWRRWLVLLAPCLCALVFLLSPGIVRERFTSILRPRTGTDSNQHRKVTWRTGVEIIRQHPWFGLGPEGVKYHFNEYVPADIPKPLPTGWYGHLHNIYLQFAAERGIPTMLILMWFLLKVAWDFWLGLRLLHPGRSDLRFILQGCLAVWIATMVAGVFEHNLGDSEVLTMFLVVVGAGYIALEQAAREHAEEVPVG